MKDIIKMITLLFYRMKRVLAEEYCVLQVITSNNTYHIQVQLLDIENTKSTKYSNENRDSSHVIRTQKVLCWSKLARQYTVTAINVKIIHW